MEKFILEALEVTPQPIPDRKHKRIIWSATNDPLRDRVRKVTDTHKLMGIKAWNKLSEAQRKALVMFYDWVMTDSSVSGNKGGFGDDRSVEAVGFRLIEGINKAAFKKSVTVGLVSPVGTNIGNVSVAVHKAYGRYAGYHKQALSGGALYEFTDMGVGLIVALREIGLSQQRHV